MIKIDVKGIPQVQSMLAAYPKQASRACEMSLDQVAKEIKEAEKAEMRRVFDETVPFTLNSVYSIPTKGHNMVAYVGIKEPPRMEQSYLFPQVEGGARKLKGFELAADRHEYEMASGAKRTSAGNITVGQAKAIVAGVKRAGKSDIVTITKQRGKLAPGVYQRVRTGAGFSKRFRKGAQYTIQKGAKRGRFSSAIQARGLKPLLIRKDRQGEAVKPLLDFYGVARRTFDRVFLGLFRTNMARVMR